MKNRFKLSLPSMCNKNQNSANSPPPSCGHSQLSAQPAHPAPQPALYFGHFSSFWDGIWRRGTLFGTACSLFGTLSLLQCSSSVTALCDKWLWEGFLFHPLPSGCTVYTLESGFWECFLLCLHYLSTNMVLQREGYTKRVFFSGFLRVYKRLRLVLGLQCWLYRVVLLF